jgi:hypothetical protein
MTELDMGSQDLRIEVHLTRDGLKAGSDNSVELLIGVVAPDTPPGGSMEGAVFRIWEGPDESPEKYELDLAESAKLAFHNISLRLLISSGITWEVASEFNDQDNVWPLRDLAWGAKDWIAMRLRVLSTQLPEVGEYMALAKIRVMAEPVREPTMTRLGSSVALLVMAAKEYDELPIDESLQNYIRDAFNE